MTKHIFGLLLTGLSLITACSSQENQGLKAGRWRATLDAQGHTLPFEMELTQVDGKWQGALINATERLALDEIIVKEDSVWIPMHIFDATLKGRLTEKGTLEGVWTKNYYDDYSLALSATPSEEPRFAVTSSTEPSQIDGRWEVYFSEADGQAAVGEFMQNGSHVTGTFLTTVGDYRFLDGVMDGHRLKLSTFDGEHAFLFEAEVQADGSLKGDFWSGSHWHETFTATRNDTLTLPDPASLTYLKEGYDGIEFSFPGLDGEPVSLSDPKYEDKIVLLQIFGTWCPNCMDETQFLTDWYPQHAEEGVEIIGLSYERKDDFDYAVDRINRIREKLNVPYDFVVAGTSDKEEASKTLPMLNQILSFPTLIILDREHHIRRIHTGFSGPGTGKYYQEFVEEFNLFMEKLINEQPPQVR